MSGTADGELERCQERVGSTLRNSWRLDGLIGVGGMAAVYAATHTTGSRGAIKILHPEIAVSRELRARFEQEALAIGQLGHPATVQVSAIDVADDGAPFMVMELLEGESLGQLAYRLGELPERVLLAYVATVLEVLSAAHERGIVHRDIKPDNLFVTSDGRVKVLDFGIARMREGGSASVRTRTGAMLGTTSYMAPEQIHARPIDGRADLFAVGATMFRILAKQKIHPAESDAELLMKMGSTPAPSLHSVAPQIDARTALIVDRALAFDRECRYPDAVTMLQDVRAALDHRAPPFATLASEATTRDGGPKGAVTVAAAVMAGGVDPTLPGEPAPAPMQPLVAYPPQAAYSPAGYPQTAPARALGAGVPAAAWGSTAARSEHRERRKISLPMVLGIGGTMLLLGGGVGAALMIDGSPAIKKKAARTAEERDVGAAPPPTATGAPAGPAVTGSTASTPSKPRAASTAGAPSTRPGTTVSSPPPPPAVAPPPVRSERPSTGPSHPTSSPGRTPSSRPSSEPITSIPSSIPTTDPGESSGSGRGRGKGKGKGKDKDKDKDKDDD